MQHRFSSILSLLILDLAKSGESGIQCKTNAKIEPAQTTRMIPSNASRSRYPRDAKGELGHKLGLAKRLFIIRRVRT